MVKRGLVAWLIVCSFQIANGQKNTADKTVHYVCFNSKDTYHDNDHCPSLLLCTGGKIRKVKDVNGLTPCKKCAKPIENYKKSGFADIKRILGVKDRAQIKDSLGTDKSTIHQPAGYTLRISGLPGSKTVNMLEFYFDNPVVFNEDSLLSVKFYNRLGLLFSGCKSDTIRSTTPHPVSGKVKKDVTIEYRGCAIVEPRDSYDDVSKYYYELIFVAKETEAGTYVEKVQLNLRVESR